MKTGKKILILICVLAVAEGLVGAGVWNIHRRVQATGIPRDAIPARVGYVRTETITSHVDAKGVGGGGGAGV